MNKYQEALDSFERTFRNVTLDDDLTNEKRDTLQELVDKASPKKIDGNWKVDFDYDGSIYGANCPSCNNSLIWEYKCCPECGQKLDWSR